MAYIEVPFNNQDSQPYRTFNLRNDSSARTLQDLKFPDRGGGFGYVSGNEMSSAVRNRFIYWRYCNGSLEILEDSLDTTLRSSWLKFIFASTCVLHAEAFERPNRVEMLVCTADSAVRLIFRHPSSTVKEDSTGASRTAASIFHEVETPRQDVVPIRALQQAGQLRCATAHVRRSDGAALFAFCLTTGSVMLVEMPPPTKHHGVSDEVEGAKIVELRQASMMSKLWSGIVPSFASRNDQVSHDTATDAVFLDEGKPTLLLTVNRDHKLRVWNVESRDLAVVTDLLECLEDKVDTRALQIKSQGHSLRRSHAGKQGTSIGVHLNFVNRSYFIIFAVNDRAEDIHSCLVPVRRILCDARQDIVDWIVVPTAQLVWLLMQSEDGYSLSSHNLREPGGAFGAVSPALFLSDVLWGEEEDSETGLSLISAQQDPQEACLTAVFAPGRFSTLAVSRAVTALRQSCQLSPTRRSAFPAGSLDALKEDVVALVESKIADSVAEMSAAHELSRIGDLADLSESDVVQLRMLHWSQFFASVLDYQRTCAARPVGLCVDHNTGLVGVVRKAGLSLFRLAEPVEVCALLPLPLLSRHTLNSVTEQPGHETEPASLKVLLKHCRYLQLCVGAPALDRLYAQMELATEDPCALAATVLSDCLRQEHEREIGQRLSAVDHLLEAFLRLVEIAEDLNDAEEMSEEEAEERMVGTFSHPERFLFASPLGVESLARSVDCILTARLRLACGLLLLQQLLTSPGSRASAHAWLSADLSTRLSGPVRIRLVNLIRNLVLMRWLSSVRLSLSAGQTLDRVASQLSLVGLNGVDSRVTPLSPNDCRRTLLELFFEFSAGETVRRRLRETGLLDASPTEPAQRLWASIFPLAASFLQASVCPSSSGLVLGLCQFLLSRGQNQVLLKMTRLLDGWWQLDPVLVHHVRALALLNSGQPAKALMNFVEALKGLTDGRWDAENLSILPSAVLGQDAAVKPLPLVQVNIALKVMRALEILEEPLLVVELAHHALQWLQASPASSHRSDDASEASERRRTDADSQMSMDDEGEDDGGSEERRMKEADAEEADQLRGILWTSVFKHELAVGRTEQAFTALLSNPDCSGRRDCLRQLVVTLCDRGQLETLVGLSLGELEEEFVGILESRARAVDLHVYNYYDLLYAFHVSKANYRAAAAVMFEQAWRVGAEVRSLPGLQKQARALLSCLTALRLVHPDHRWLLPGGVVLEADDGPEVVELAEVERKYALVKARLRVAEMDIDHSLLSAGPLSVADTTRCLLKVGLYNVAVHICRLFEQPLDAVFEALAARCVSLPQPSASGLGHRDLQLEKAVQVECLEEMKPGPGYEGLPAAQLAWTLLQTLLDTHGDGKYWRCAVAKLLACGHMPPAWLVAEGKRRNPSTLLRLFIVHDEVEAAVTLAIDCIDDACAKGGGPSVAASDLRWLPHMWIQQLLAGLELLERSNAECGLMRDKLQTKLNGYFDLLQQASQDRALLRMTRGAKMHLQDV